MPNTMIFTVTLNPASSRTVTVDWETQDDTAIAGEHYVADSGTLTFAPTETEKTIEVTLIGDTELNENRQFKVILSNPAYATILKEEGLATIIDDDGGLNLLNLSAFPNNAVWTSEGSLITPQAVDIINPRYLSVSGGQSSSQELTADVEDLPVILTLPYLPDIPYGRIDGTKAPTKGAGFYYYLESDVSDFPTIDTYDGTLAEPFIFPRSGGNGLWRRFIEPGTWSGAVTYEVIYGDWEDTGDELEVVFPVVLETNDDNPAIPPNRTSIVLVLKMIDGLYSITSSFLIGLQIKVDGVDFGIPVYICTNDMNPGEMVVSDFVGPPTGIGYHTNILITATDGGGDHDFYPWTFYPVSNYSPVVPAYAVDPYTLNNTVFFGYFYDSGTDDHIFKSFSKAPVGFDPGGCLVNVAGSFVSWDNQLGDLTFTVTKIVDISGYESTGPYVNLIDKQLFAVYFQNLTEEWTYGYQEHNSFYRPGDTWECVPYIGATPYTSGKFYIQIVDSETPPGF